MGKPDASVFKVEENPDARKSKFHQNVGIFYKNHIVISHKTAIIRAQNICMYSDHMQGIQLYRYNSFYCSPKLMVSATQICLPQNLLRQPNKPTDI
jgi:hypothetical protein